MPEPVRLPPTLPNGRYEARPTRSHGRNLRTSTPHSPQRSGGPRAQERRSFACTSRSLANASDSSDVQWRVSATRGRFLNLMNGDLSTVPARWPCGRYSFIACAAHSCRRCCTIFALEARSCNGTPKRKTAVRRPAPGSSRRADEFDRAGSSWAACARRGRTFTEPWINHLSNVTDVMSTQRLAPTTRLPLGRTA